MLLEEELGLSLSDDQVAELRTVGDLLAALEQTGQLPRPPAPLPGWPRSWPVRALRAALQDAILFPLLRRSARPLTVEGRERLTGLRGPALLIANHASHFDSLTVLAALPEARRRRTAVAAAADYFFKDSRLAFVSSFLLGAFPFHRTGPVAASLAHCGDLADGGNSLLVFPEGTRSTTGEIAPFKPGIGLLARELGLPVVPIYLDGLFNVLPKGRTLPRPGPVRVVVGWPRRIEPGLSNVDAAAALERSLRALAASVGYLHAGANGKFRCRCCGYYTLDEMATGTYEICPVCFWEDDPVQDYDPDYAGGANEPSLNEARRNFKQFGASEARLLEHVRPPRQDEIPPSDRHD